MRKFDQRPRRTTKIENNFCSKPTNSPKLTSVSKLANSPKLTSVLKSANSSKLTNGSKWATSPRPIDEQFKRKATNSRKLIYQPGLENGPKPANHLGLENSPKPSNYSVLKNSPKPIRSLKLISGSKWISSSRLTHGLEKRLKRKNWPGLMNSSNSPTTNSPKIMSHLKWESSPKLLINGLKQVNG